MAWIELHQGVFAHHKTMKASRRLGVPVAHTVGLLTGLWCWALDYAQDGTLFHLDPEDVAEAAGWEGDAAVFVAALLKAGYLEQQEAGLVIHDWMSYAGRLVALRQKEAARKAKARDLHDNITLVDTVRKRDRDLCRYCGIEVNWKDRRGGTGGTYDHVIPGGPNTVDNIVVACRSCNAGKSNRTPEQAGYLLNPVDSGQNTCRKPAGNLPGSAGNGFGPAEKYLGSANPNHDHDHDHDPPLPPVGVVTDLWAGFDEASRTLLEEAAAGMTMGGYELPLRMLRQLEARAGAGKVSEAVLDLWSGLTLTEKAKWIAVAMQKTHEAKVARPKLLAYAASVIGSALEGGTALGDEAPKVIDPSMALRPWYGIYCQHAKNPAEPTQGQVWNFCSSLGLPQPAWQAAWAIAQQGGPMAVGDWAWEQRRDIA